MHAPGFGHGQRLAVHGGGRRQEPQKAHLGHACSGAAGASQTLMSGKLNEVINRIVRDVDSPACARNQRWIEAEPAAWTDNFGFVNRPFDTGEDDLTCRTPFPGSGFMKPAMEINRQVDAGAC